MPKSTSSMDDCSEDFSKMKTKFFTTNYKYNSEEQEFVFCCKGKPFATLVSSNIPTPTSNLIDYNLVKDLGLKMTDLQCQKFYFAGNRFRILGKISTSVQCIEGGVLSGMNFHIKGFVVSDLNKILDTHCVAGVRMKGFLLSTFNNDVVIDVPDAPHVSQKVPVGPDVSHDAHDDPHVPPDAHDDPHVPPDAHDDPHMPPGVHDDPHMPPGVQDVPCVSPSVHNASHVPASTGARRRPLYCVQCHNDLSGTIDQEFIRCTTCHEKLLMMLAKMPHKWFQPAFREEMSLVRGIQCKAEYSDLEDSDASSYCSKESPFRKDWGREPWKRDWEERLKRKRRR